VRLRFPWMLCEPGWWKPGSDPDWPENDDANDLPVESRRFEAAPLMFDCKSDENVFTHQSI